MELSYVTQTIIDSLSLIDFSLSPTGSLSTILRIYTYTSVRISSSTGLTFVYKLIIIC